MWYRLLIFGTFLDALTTYLFVSSGGGEFNPVAARLIELLGPLHAVALLSAGSIILGALLLRSGVREFRAAGVAYAAFRWVPGAHNALLMLEMPSDPLFAVLSQYFATLLFYVYILWHVEELCSKPSCSSGKKLCSCNRLGYNGK